MSEVSQMINLICEDKGLEYDTVIDAVETALGAAYRKDFGNRQQNIKFSYNPDTGDMKAWDVKEVVEDMDEKTLEENQEELSRRREEARNEGRELTEEETEDLVRFNPKTEMMISEAKKIKKKVKAGDTLEIDLEIPGDFGRMAAQTAKQVIIQKLREAERNTVFEDFKNQEGKIVQGTVQRRDKSGAVIIDLGKITGILPSVEQVRTDRYVPGVRLPFFVASVGMGTRGPEIILSRTDNKMVEVVFLEEIPEIEEGAVKIEGIARDPGHRSKVAVSTEDDAVDPIGSCIGQRGSRINTIIDKLGGEKIDIIQYSTDPVEYIINSMSPAKVESVELDEDKKEASVSVAHDQFSLAIGRNGQNVRLASELTGWTINVNQIGEAANADEEQSGLEDVEKEDQEVQEVDKKEEVEEDQEEDVVENVEEEKEEEVDEKEG